jgi:hypothetical protein
MLPGGQRPQRDDSEQHYGTPSTTAEGEGIMATSRFELTGRILAGIAAASLLMGVSMDVAAAAYGNSGAIRLQLGGGQPSRFVYETAGGVITGSAETFKIVPGSKCFLGNWSGKDLISLLAFGPRTLVDPDSRLGLGPDSIGVYDNSKGVSCYRMTGSIDEGVEFRLDGTELAKIVSGDPSSTDKYYFDRLELDLEVKQNAVVFLDVYQGATQLNTYELRSGNRIVVGQGSTGESSQLPGEDIFNCGANSDSGPDSGASDNCRWIINDIGDRFRLYPAPETDSEVSLEGGGDFSDPRANNTIIFLTKLVDTGDLYCNPNVDQSLDNKTGTVGGGPVASCQTTRINPNNLGQNICDDFPADRITYSLETFLGAGSECELLKIDGTQGVQIAGSMQITFEPENSLDPAWGARQTKIRFTKPDLTQTLPYDAPRCRGTVVDDANGNPTILEVLSGSPPVWVQDQITDTLNGPDNGFIDWACVLEHEEVYLGDGKMQVTQTILFWGDFAMSRQ